MKRVLIADNMPNLISTMKIFLSDIKDIVIDDANTIEDAQKMLESKGYDLLITDISFDETRDNKNGLFLAEYAINKGIAVVVVTGVYTREELEAEFIKIGVDKILIRNKASFESALVSTVKELIDERHN